MGSAEEKAYHLKRIMFYIDETTKKVWYTPRTNRSHKEWLVEYNNMSEEEFNKIVRGIAYTNEIIMYQGDFEYNKHVKTIAKEYYKGIIKYLQLDNNTPVYGGVIKGKIGERWKGYKLIANGIDSEKELNNR